MSSQSADSTYRALLERKRRGDMSYLLESPVIVPEDGCIDPQLTVLNNAGDGCIDSQLAHLDADENSDANFEPNIFDSNSGDGLSQITLLDDVHAASPSTSAGSASFQQESASGRFSVAPEDRVTLLVPIDFSATYYHPASPVDNDQDRRLQNPTLVHIVDEGVATSKDGSGHVKYEGLRCCAVGCRFGHQTPKSMRKDKLTQHMWNLHRFLNSRFRCISSECPHESLSLQELILHMDEVGLHKDVRYSAIVAAAQKMTSV